LFWNASHNSGRGRRAIKKKGVWAKKREQDSEKRDLTVKAAEYARVTFQAGGCIILLAGMPDSMNTVTSGAEQRRFQINETGRG
jgi:hypothetical protein